MVFVDPMITVRVKLALASAPFITSLSPPTVVWNVKVTVCGSSRTVLVSDRPPESVAVSLSSR
jgi:hypothetical protein